MTTAETSAPAGRVPEPRAAAPDGAPAVAEPAAARLRRIASGALLALAAITAIAGAVVVVWFRVGFAPVLSPSMEPAFGAGDLLVTRVLPASGIEVGDVVVLPRPDAPGERYAHRVVSVEREPGQGPVVRTQGDANAAPDPQALRVDSPSVPLVVTSVPSAGRLSLAGQHAWPRIAVIVLIGCCVLVALKRALLDRGARARTPEGADTDGATDGAAGAAAAAGAEPDDDEARDRDLLPWPAADPDAASGPVTAHDRTR